jgi:hypothetical protein
MSAQFPIPDYRDASHSPDLGRYRRAAVNRRPNRQASTGQGGTTIPLRMSRPNDVSNVVIDAPDRRCRTCQRTPDADREPSRFALREPSYARRNCRYGTGRLQVITSPARDDVRFGR